MWIYHKFFKYSTAIILLLLIVFLLGQVDFFLIPIGKVLATLFLPLLVSGLLYYLLRPPVKLLVKFKIPKTVSIIIVLVVTCILAIFIISNAGSMIASEFNQLIANFPKYLRAAEDLATDILNNPNLDLFQTENISGKISDFIQKSLPKLGEGIFSGISAVVNTTTLLLMVPFILFYLLKDDKLFRGYLVKILPDKYEDEGSEIFDDVDKTLSDYITGQAIVAAILGISMYIGYLIIGLNYALVLGLFAMFTAIIPFIGAFLGIVPALLVGLSYEPFMLIKILIVMIVVQQVEGGLITPQIMGKRMNIHPLTVVLALLAASALYGFLGMLLAIPAYGTLKVLIKNGIRIYKLRKASALSSGQ